jgi:hypothetical protein
VRSASLILIGQAAFHAAVEQYPRSRLTLRQGARGDPETARVIECTLIKIKDGNRSATEEKHGRPLTADALAISAGQKETSRWGSPLPVAESFSPNAGLRIRGATRLSG